MNRHLDDNDIAAIAAGEYNREVAEHVDTCASCRLEVEQFSGALSHFRGAIRDWSGSQFSSRIIAQPRMRLWPGLAYACTIAIIALVAVIGYRFSIQPGKNTPPSAAESDTLLLKQVKADVSRSTPPGMETLLGFTSTGAAQR